MPNFVNINSLESSANFVNINALDLSADWEAVEKKSVSTPETASNKTPGTSANGVPSAGPVLSADDAATLQEGRSSTPSPRDVKLGLPSEASRTSTGETTPPGSALDDWEVVDKDAIKQSMVEEARKAAKKRLETQAFLLDALSFLGGPTRQQYHAALKNRTNQASAKPENQPWVIVGQSSIDAAKAGVAEEKKAMKKRIKKDIERLNVLDYLCGNPMRPQHRVAKKNASSPVSAQP